MSRQSTGSPGTEVVPILIFVLVGLARLTCFSQPSALAFGVLFMIPIRGQPGMTFNLQVGFLFSGVWPIVLEWRNRDRTLFGQ